jgi:hypothetical protein
MIILHRVTPFFLCLGLVYGLYLLLFSSLHPVMVAGAIGVFLLVLMARLLEWKVATYAFWHFAITSLLFAMSSVAMIFLAEQEMVRYVVAVLCIGLATLFSEYVFQYIHLPATYQPYSLEYLTLFLNTLSVFYITSVGFGAGLLLQTSLLLVSVILLPVFGFIIYGTLFVSKVDESRLKPYTVAVSFLLTQSFIVVSFLPSGFFTGAAFLTIIFYVLLGLTRAHVLRTLSQTVLKRYLTVGSLLLIATVLSTSWL